MLVRVVVFYFLTLVFTIALGGGPEASGLSAETLILAQWGPGLAALLMISYSFVIYALVATIGFNVLVAAVFHLMINVANLFTYSIVNQVEFMMISSLV